MEKSILNRLLLTPNLAKSLSDPQWDLCLRQAQAANLLGRLQFILEQYDNFQYLPHRALNHLNAALLHCKKQHQDIRAEAKRLSSQLTKHGLEITYLKGAAYVLTGIASQGRICSDIDILVRKSQLIEVEQRLEDNGWAPEAINDYDKKYYRQWMHEIPPMIHLARHTVLDVHHNIVPLTAEKLPNAHQLLESRCRSGNKSEHYVLAPMDMILHSAVHLFSEGELDKGLRDLTDLDLLFKNYFSDPSLKHRRCQQLFARANQLNLESSLVYALRYCDKILNTTLPELCLSQASHSRVNPLKLALLDYCYEHTLVPYHSSCQGLHFELACFILYLRSHLKKMPLRLLLPHLSIKWWQRAKKLFIVT